MPKKEHGKEEKDNNGNRVISKQLRDKLKQERKRLGLDDKDWEPENVSPTQ